MAITLVNTTRIAAALSGAIPSTAAGNTLYIAFGGSAGAGSTGTCSTSGATLGGVALAKMIEVDAPASASAACAVIYQGANIAAGQTAVAVAGTNLVAADCYLVAWEVSGMGTAPVLDVSSSLESHTGTTSWSSDAGTAPVTTVAAEFWVGVHAAGPNSAQTDTLTPAGAWTNQAALFWGAPGGATIAGAQIAAATGSLRYNGTSADFDFYVTAVAAFAPGGSPVIPDLAMATRIAP
jgi:hypothetical protein